MELGDEVSLLSAEEDADNSDDNGKGAMVVKPKIANRKWTDRKKLKKKTNGGANNTNELMNTSNITAKISSKNNVTDHQNKTTKTGTKQHGRTLEIISVDVDDENAFNELNSTSTQIKREKDDDDDDDGVDQQHISNNSSLLSYEFTYGSNRTTSENSNTTSDNELQMELAPPVPMSLTMGKSTGRQPLPTDDDFVTQRPPSQGDGCQTRNIDGEWVEHYQLSIFRKYHDWAGRCSSWCECLANGTSKCQEIGCLSDMLCETRHTTIGFGQRLYLEDRGACQCHEGRFICDSSEFQRELQPGIYITLGYSKTELELIRKNVPKPLLERSGLISQSSSLVKDLATRLQFALERVLPTDIKCRIAVLEHFPPEQVVLLQLQWFGVDPSSNQTRAKWHSGKMEKYCSPYVRELERKFLLEEADRYQLLMSTIKQIRVIDLLDALPRNAAQSSTQYTASQITTFLKLLTLAIWLFLAKSTLIHASFFCAFTFNFVP